MMQASRPKPRRISDSRAVVTTLLLLMLVAMIVRDILVRRWNSAPQGSTDVTQRDR
jgi:hypothetical protein